MNKLKQYREHAGLTQYELSRKTGLSLSMISKVERDETGISIENAFFLSDALGATMEEIWGLRVS